MSQIIETNIQTGLSENTFKVLKNSFDVTINRLLSYLDINYDDIFKNEQIIFSGNTAEQLKALRQYFFIVIDCISNSINDVNNDLTRILHYIDKNINRDISLDDLAQYLGYSLWKTSRIFKSLFNQNFKNYIIDRKVEISKSLLLQGLKVNEVSAMIGCNSTGTFIHMFKKSVGITSGEFKKSILQTTQKHIKLDNKYCTLPGKIDTKTL